MAATVRPIPNAQIAVSENGTDKGVARQFDFPAGVTVDAGIATIDVTVGAIGATGPTGETGPTGAAGTIWLAGAGVPDDGNGANGDLYLNTATGDVYEKVAGTWF